MKAKLEDPPRSDPVVAPRKTSMSDLEKELEDFDLDASKDDVSNIDIPSTNDLFDQLKDEQEVKMMNSISCRFLTKSNK